MTSSIHRQVLVLNRYREKCGRNHGFAWCNGWVLGASLHVDVAIAVPALSDRLLKRLERELVKGKAPQRAYKEAAARRMKRIISSHLAETS